MLSDQSILIVDDDATSRRLLARTLTASGYVCRESESGIDALKLIRNEQPSVLLLDLKMPGLDGAETLKRLRADPNPVIAQIPTIMFTGHGESEVLCLEAGADDFVIKPINVEVLRARIETHLRLRSLRMQLQLQNEKLEEWRRNLERDLAAARLTQRSLIPQKPLVISGWKIATHYRPVIEVGGDIYGWHRLKDKRCLFWIADAAGHGASAALLTTLAKLLFQHGSNEESGAAAIMRTVNNDFRNTFGGRSFMTAMCVALNADTGDASVAGAGHPPLLVTRFGRGTETIASSSPPLGLAEESQFAETNINLGRGDAFILYTDGLLGAVSRGGSRPTPIQLAGMVNPFAPNAEGILDRVLKQAAPVDETKSLPDDVAAIAVRREN